MIAHRLNAKAAAFTVITCLAIALVSVLFGCGRSESVNSVFVQSKLADWARPQFKPGGGSATVFYVVYGQFPTNIQLFAMTYRTVGIPQGVSLRKSNREQRPVFPFTDGDFAKLIERESPATFSALQTAPQCVIIQGEITDPADLNYLRDSIGVATWFLDNGGVGVVDPQQVKPYAPTAWHEEVFEPTPPKLANHVVILFSKESDGTQWFHTRGLRKFGRPDLSLHHVPQSHTDAAIELFNRFIIMQAEGGLIPEGQPIRTASLPDGMTCHHQGSTDDPDFNNMHVEIRWPTGSRIEN